MFVLFGAWAVLEERDGWNAANGEERKRKMAEGAEAERREGCFSIFIKGLYSAQQCPF